MQFINYLKMPFQFDASAASRLKIRVAPTIPPVKTRMLGDGHPKIKIWQSTSRLRADLGLVDLAPWSLHGNRMIYRGEWSGLSLRNSSGDPADLAADTLRESQFVGTALLEHCDYIPQIMGTFQCLLGSVRFLKVAAGAEIDEHVDGGLCYEYGEMRLHIPVRTHAEVDFRLNGERLMMQPGECWYINANMPHSVANRGTEDRVHLVIDAGVNDWLRDQVEGRCLG